MKSDAYQALIPGKYYWQLLFHQKNDHDVRFSGKYKFKTKSAINPNVFLSNVFGIETCYSYKGMLSISLRYDKESVPSSHGYSLHNELAFELIERFGKSDFINRTRLAEAEYKIDTHGELSMYILCFESDGMLMYSQITNSEKHPVELIGLRFICTKRILGLEELLDVFVHTEPTETNLVEWGAIRDNIVRFSDLSDERRFRFFVETLSTICPQKHNIVEWERIRITCNEILNVWAEPDKQVLLKKLLIRFSTTIPKEHNQLEWDQIRNMCNALLQDVAIAFTQQL
jgi:hypothetical protein